MLRLFVFLPSARIQLDKYNIIKGLCFAILTWITVCEQGANWQQDLWYGQRRRPVVLEYVQADDALAVDVAVIDARAERDFGRLEGVLRREVYVEEEDATLVDGSGWSQDGGDPLVQIVALGSGTAVGRWV